MKSSYLSLPRRGRVEVVLSLILSVGIVAAALFPTPEQVRRFAGTKQSIFALVERDYISPLFSSAIAIRALNGAAKQFASFAGYDDFRTRLEVNSAISLVSVTRFSGDLLDILKVDFALRDHRYKDEPCVYLSEALWTTGFARRADIVGTMIKVHDTNYRIAGVTRAFNGLLATTEIWMPISSRGQLGA
ncbi:MAG: hypothetical protein ACXW32_17030, partial [Limisphaerales bacterium]